MAHYSQEKFVEICTKNLKKENKNFKKFTILDIGSYDLNGSVKKYFKNNNYLGVDLYPGPNVDIVMDGSQLKELKKKFDITISCNCFEHAKNWDEIFKSMYDVLNNDGILIFSCASTGFLEHGTKRINPNDSFETMHDYYKNLTRRNFEKKFNIKKMFNTFFFNYNIYSHDLYFIGGKNIKKTKLNINKILCETKKIKTLDKKIYYKRLIYSHILSDKLYQNLMYYKKKTQKYIKSFFRNILKY